MNRYHAHRADFEDRPRITTEDWKALAWLICFVVIFFAICAVVQP